MESKIKSIIYRINDIFNTINDIEYKLTTVIVHGVRDSLLRRLPLLKSNLNQLINNLDKKVNPDIIIITFRYLDTLETWRRLYCGISEDDAKFHLDYYLNMKGIKYEILEIKIINAKDSLTKL